MKNIDKYQCLDCYYVGDTTPCENCGSKMISCLTFIDFEQQVYPVTGMTAVESLYRIFKDIDTNFRDGYIDEDKYTEFLEKIMDTLKEIGKSGNP